MKRKPYIRKPTHRLVDENGKEYAVLRCDGKPAVRLTETGETVRSASWLLSCDLLMGRWQNAVYYMFGTRANHIPLTARIEPIPQTSPAASEPSANR